MFIGFLFALKQAGLPVSLQEFLTLLGAVERNLAEFDVDHFYFLARATLVKDERHIDRFDRVFGEVFKGLERPAAEGEDPGDRLAELPEEWLRRLAERFLSEEEKAQVEALGGWDTLMETLRRRLAEQQGRHQGGSKWIGTAGTSPFGAYGYNPEGVRIGQDRSRHRRAVKVWDRREFRNFDDQIELGTRSMQLALRRLRRFARDGTAKELDLPGTIDGTARQGGWLDLHWRAERRNAINVLLFLDVGGSMDDHVQAVEELFSAARSAFKSLHAYYFHNCPYDGVWVDNRRRHTERVATLDLLHTHGPQTRAIFVGDAAMSPYEIAVPGGAVEEWNEEAGAVWLKRLADHFPRCVWLNPIRRDAWPYYRSIGMVAEILEGRMFPLSLDGIDHAVAALAR